MWFLVGYFSGLAVGFVCGAAAVISVALHDYGKSDSDYEV